MDKFTIHIVLEDNEQTVSKIPLIDPVIAENLSQEGRRAIIKAAQKAAHEATLFTDSASQ